MDKAHCMGSKREPVVRAIADAVQMALVRSLTAPSPRTRAALFFPSNVAFRYVLGLLEGASRSLDICVYTITDRQITERILAAHERNVRVRIATDDKKAFDQGSAVFALAQAGIPTVVSEQDDGWTPEGGGGVRERHMHHKFAVVDGATLLTGSFNWTVAAHQRNSENLLVTDEPYFVAKYSGEFERVWDSCRRDNRLGTNAAARRIQALYRGRSFRRSFSKESFSRLVLGEGDDAGPGTLTVSREPEPSRGSDAGVRPTVDDMPMPGRAPAQPRPQ